MNVIEELVNIFIRPIVKAIRGIFEPILGHPTKEETSDLEKAVHSLVPAAFSAATHSEASVQGLSPAAAQTELEKYAVRGADNARNAWILSMAVEVASAGLVDISVAGYLALPTTRAYFDIVTEIWAAEYMIGKLPFYRRQMLSEHRPTLPGAQDLPPMLWRQKISEDKFKEILAEQGFSDEFVTAYTELARLIPGYQDLITLMVREIITPADFITWIGRQGYSSYWASALYDAHFRLPSPEHVYDAFHRGLISEAELNKYIFWHDYQPTPRPDISKTDLAIMRGLTKTLIPRVDLRRAWLQGEISDAELESRYGWLGYEDDAALMARIQKAVALTPQRNTVRNMFLRGLRQGVYSEDVVRARLKELRYPGAAVDLLIEAENVRREIGAVELGEEPRILSTSHITRAYKSRLITRSAAAEMLAAQGWDPGAADMLLMLSEPVPEKEAQLSAVKTAAATLYREGYMSPSEFEGHLRAANYSDEDIERIRLAEDLRYRWDFLKDLQAADVEAYRKDILTLEELTVRLLERDLQPERAAALLAKEAYKKLPKPKPALA